MVSRPVLSYHHLRNLLFSEEVLRTVAAKRLRKYFRHPTLKNGGRGERDGQKAGRTILDVRGQENCGAGDDGHRPHHRQRQPAEIPHRVSKQLSNLLRHLSSHHRQHSVAVDCRDIPHIQRPL